MTAAPGLYCCDEARRALVRAYRADPENPVIDAIEFLEVVVDPAAPPTDIQRHLRVHFVAGASSALQVRIDAGELAPRVVGGARITGIAVVSATKATLPDGEVVLDIWVDRPGDFSVYTLELLDRQGDRLPDFDVVLYRVEFSFKVECGDDFDCRGERSCPPARVEPPEIDYLAKDYASFRRLMLDRMALLVPDWRDRNPSDIGVTLVELLAYVADHLSYTQDAIATEAYLGTARRRASVRRHARLLDYAMHDGCNARAWVVVEFDAKADGRKLPARTRLYTARLDLPRQITEDRLEDRLRATAECFETMTELTLRAEHHEIDLYAWGDRDCWLPRGATRATLLGRMDKLAAGDVLVFEERVGPRTDRVEDADPKRRHVVRLTHVAALNDPLVGVELTAIEWGEDDALPFSLCISATADEQFGGGYVKRVSVARGNVVLADHGRAVEQTLPPVPSSDPRLAAITGDSCSRCAPAEPVPAPIRYRPRLRHAPLTMVGPAPRPTASARAAMTWSMDHVLPDIRLTPGTPAWAPRRDLLGGSAFSHEFVVEVDDDGVGTLRFGDDQHGARPAPGTEFTALYRVGNGTRGNVGAGALWHIVSDIEGVEGVRNPLPARGGRDPESIEDVRRDAPTAFRRQERAVTPADWAEAAERHPYVQRAVARLGWTGSWRTVFLTVDRLGGRPVDPAFEAELRAHLERYRLAGLDLEIEGPKFVPLAIDVNICVDPGYFRSDVKAAVLRALGSDDLPGGRRGLFHPDNFSFADPVHLSRLYAAAQAVAGVRSVAVTRFERLGVPSRAALESGVLAIGPLEIARLDNDPNFPERGVLHVRMEGGR